MWKQPAACLLISLCVAFTGCKSPSPDSAAQSKVDVRSLAKQAYIYGYPIVDNYRVQYSYFVDEKNSDYKAPYNHLFNIPRVYTPEDKAIQTPNSDTPYSWIGLDLRSEPMVFTVPPIQKDRYWSLQLIDLYTHNFDYLGTRATGNGGGSFMIAGPNWNGPVPKGIIKVIRCETEIASAQFRTQLFNAGDLDNVKKIQSRYIAQPLSSFLHQKPPAPAPAISFIPPLTPDAEKSSLEFFNILNFALQYCPTHPSERELRAKFASIGIVPGKQIDFNTLSPETRNAMQDGIADAWRDFDALKAKVDQGQVTSGDLFGTRDFLKNNYLYRMAGAVLGIYGNTKEEAIYPIYFIDHAGARLTGDHAYILHFAPGQLPPVNAFWSLTMYQLPSSLLVENPIHRYLLNSTMLPHFHQDPDGGITLRIQHQPPGKELQPNWLPAPDGPFMVILRLYYPRAEALNGTWTPPPLDRVKE